MPTCKVLKWLMPRLCRRKTIGLSEFIKSIRAEVKVANYLFRPSNDDQTKLMIAGYIEGFTDHWANGGYIVVSRKMASFVLLKLSHIGVSAHLRYIKNADDFAGFLKIGENTGVHVLIEDEGLPREVMESWRKMMQFLITKHLHMEFGPQAKNDPDLNRAQRFCKTNPLQHIMFIDIDLPNRKDFILHMSQMRSLGLGTCMIYRENAYDRKVNELSGAEEINQEEMTAIKANSIKVYGSGLQHFDELVEDHGQLLRYEAASANAQGKATYIMPAQASTKVDQAVLIEESSLGLAFGFGDAAIIDLSR